MRRYSGPLLSAAILAGGRSRRMGHDKALLEIAGRPMLELVAERAAAVADELFIVASGRPEYARFGFPVVEDRFPGLGSLGGIYTALVAAAHPYCLVVGCDMPLLHPALLRYLAEQTHDYDALVPALAAERSDQGGEETLEALHAIYSRAAAPVLEARLRAGQLKIADALAGLRLRRVDEATIRRFDPQLRSFLNVNTPDQVDMVIGLLEHERAARP
ncbi:MAG TPA: molybdenum cofactor guanylyltransferase [Thermomicrobiaceae bacterium]|nr:molybdenum cofactor guanylyltransferase [Thermomicrobiaceae bacterium]